MNAVVGDLDTFDFGTEKWDFITLFYMHGWQRRSKTDVVARVSQALKPGGLLVIEAFADPPNGLGLKADELSRSFGKLKVLRSESVVDEPDWDVGTKKPLVRFVAEKR